MTGPRFTAEAEPHADWGRWPRPRQPLLPDLWAGDSRRFWAQPVDQAPVDRVRTARLAEVNVPVRTIGGRYWNGAVYGQPVQMVATGAPTTPVADTRHGWFPPWTWAQRANVRMPLPPVIRLEADPGAYWDRHWRCIEGNRWLWEVWLLDRARWPESTIAPFRCGGWARWDLAVPWNAPGQPLGVVAAGIPHLPLVMRWDEIQRHELGHAGFLVLDNYAPRSDGLAGPARNSDGTHVGHPCRAGERLRLTLAALDRITASFPAGHPRHTVAVGWRRFGLVVGDRRWWPGTAGPREAVVTQTQDVRFDQGEPESGLPALGDMGLSLTDFEVVASPP